MASLLVGSKISDTQILVDTIYNLDVSENDGIDRAQGVIVDSTILPPLNLAPGSYYYVNPVTKEQWFA